MKQTRRDFIKTNAIAATAAAAGVTIPGIKQAAAAADDALKIRWDKAACRFCGTGCSVLVGVQNDRVVATQGDPDAPVNKGLNCIKGYFLSKIMYGKDRLTQPLLRKRNGKFDKTGNFEPVSWDEAFDVMADKFKAAIRKSMQENKGKPVDKITSRVGMFGSGQWTIFEGYAASKLYKAVSAPITWTPTHAIAWPLPWAPLSAASARTSPWAATTTSSTRTPSCCGVQIWPRCTPSCGRASPTPA